jgi:hypothetical protein
MADPAPNRRLATILFADIEGYSRMMRADEEQTLLDLRAHLAELVGPVVERFRGRIVKTVPRDGLWAAQTPQVFRRQLLLDAFAQRDDFQPTDEAQLVERLGQPVHVVECSPMNLKITSPEDFRLAQALVDHIPQPGIAKMLHPFEDERGRSL